MKIIVISDTHNSFPPQMPNGDLLIYCGDYSKLPYSYKMIKNMDEYRSYKDELFRLNSFFEQCRLHYREVIFIPGNHDFFFEKMEEEARSILSSATVLIDQSYTFEGLKIWGSPISLRFYNWAYNRDPGADIMKHWDLIPTDTDILITHGPPYGILDQVQGDVEHLGDPYLLKAVERIKPKLHCFGHIHTGHGLIEKNGTIFINGSLLNESYELVYRPVTVKLV